ncbi:MAG: hypothetical protein IPQ02_03770 [Saprospiraceae bacterium]|nr:hypothetical protein [Candidatus Defluviibacterium haderslevense]
MKYLLPFSIALILFVSCDDEKVEPVVSKSFTIKNLPADPGTGRDSVGNLIGDKKLFTFLDFQIVLWYLIQIVRRLSGILDLKVLRLF